MFPYEKLDVYHVAVEAADVLDQLIPRIQRVRPKLADQIDRAMDSAILTICEGSARFFPAEKAQFYRIARGSVNEVAGALRRARRKGLAPEEEAKQAELLIIRVSTMLHRLILRMESEPRSNPGYKPRRSPPDHRKRRPTRPPADPDSTEPDTTDPDTTAPDTSS